MRVLVTGAGGFVGQAVVTELLAKGHKVRAMYRRPPQEEVLKNLGATPFQGDVTEPHAVAEAVKGMDAVAHAAARVSYTGHREAFERVNVGGTMAVLSAALAAGVKRFVNVSTESVTLNGKARDGQDETADIPSDHIDSYSQTKAVAEQMVLDAHGKCGASTASVRPGWVWGPGDLSVVPSLVHLSQQGMLMHIGGGSRITVSYVDHVAQVVALAVERPDVTGALLVTDDDAHPTAKDWVDLQLRTVGAPLPTRTLPAEVALAAAYAADKAWSALPIPGRTPVPLAMVLHMTRSWALNGQRARDLLGYKPRVSREEGLKRLAQWAMELGGPHGVVAAARRS